MRILSKTLDEQEVVECMDACDVRLHVCYYSILCIISDQIENYNYNLLEGRIRDA